jgi:hypothetical protein
VAISKTEMHADYDLLWSSASTGLSCSSYTLINTLTTAEYKQHNTVSITHFITVGGIELALWSIMSLVIPMEV